ncbi:hypothetical protein HHK36_006947 [Tetracentron sinense]|uniref:NAC domain-containing protein n=1 Tax=Tetracentron sinense TaxID=13715 RepID=A0A834ZQN3_TETSI|nr:hypothetical protein HHK36_006947 [Tetracentron sinense]
MAASSSRMSYIEYEYTPLIPDIEKSMSGLVLSPKMEENLPPGFRFHPTDEELITYYLTRKVSDFNFASRAITDVDLNKCEPWDLPGKATMGEKEWYFFSLRDRKYPTGLRTNRATDAGYWKTTGKDKEIFHSGVLVGMKKTLVFYKGRAPKGEKSNWVMHEYRRENKFSFKPTKEEWVVCRVFQKRSTVKKSQQTPSLESPRDTTTIVNELGDIELPHLSSLANSSSDFSTISSHNNNDNNGDMNMNMNWVLAREAAKNSLLSWPSSLLNSNFSMNSMLLRALQLGGGYPPREAATTTNYSFLPQENSLFGTDMNSNVQAASSSSKLMDSLQQQSFNLDSIW